MSVLKILIVDDNKDIRLLVRTWLSSEYNVDEAIDGDNCLLKLKENHYDILLLDVMMPGPRSNELVKSVITFRNFFADSSQLNLF